MYHLLSRITRTAMSKTSFARAAMSKTSFARTAMSKTAFTGTVRLVPLPVLLIALAYLFPAIPAASASTLSGTVSTQSASTTSVNTSTRNDTAFSGTGTASYRSDPDTLWFLIRVDDIYFRAESYQGMHMPHNFTDFQSAVEEFGAKVTWGVIPHRLIEPLNATGHMARDLRESAARGHEVSVHGYTHICPLNCERSPYGHEMYCPTRNHHFTFEEQSALLGKSMKLLRDSLDIVPTSFIAPGHHLDATTNEVLVDLDLSAVSNYRHGTDGSYPGKVIPGLVDVPVHGEFTWALTPANYNSELTQAIADVKERGEADGYYNLMLHDPFTRPGYYDGLVIDWMTDLLDTLTSYYGDRIRFLTLSEAAAKFLETEVAAEDYLADLPEGLVLDQNYPNPFNPVTTIGYALPEPGRVSITVYSALGQEVARLVDGYADAGRHEVHFDASNLSSGLYIYRLQAGNASADRKLLLVK